MNTQTTSMGRNFFMAALIMLAISLSGCGAVHTMVKKRNLDVQTKMSETIFLEPRKAADRIIYVSVKNTSDKDLGIKQQIISKLKESGFKLTSDPAKAKYMLQANVLQCGKSDLRAATNALNAGFGGAVVGLAGAAALGAGGKGMAGAGLLGAMAGVIGDALVDDTYFAMVTDLQIRERPLAGEKIEQYTETNAKQGTSSKTRQKVSGGKVSWKTYRTRVMSTANKANLKFAEAKPELENGLIRSISGVFIE